MMMLQRKQVHDHPYRILIFGGSRSGKLNALLNLIKNKDVDNYSFINKIYLYVFVCLIYQYLIKEQESLGL